MLKLKTMPTITADKVVNHNIFAKKNVTGYKYDYKTPTHNFSAGQLIGNVYSWTVAPDGQVYWMVYVSPYDYANFNPTYIPNIVGALDLPDLPGILEQIEKEKEAKEIEEKGLLRYYIEKYAPWIVGGIVVAVSVPALNKNKTVNGMTPQDKNTAALVGGLALLFLLAKYRKGSLEIPPPDQGEFVPDTDTTTANPTTGTTGTQETVYIPSERISSVGVFPVIYEPQMINGRKKINLGSIKTW